MSSPDRRFSSKVQGEQPGGDNVADSVHDHDIGEFQTAGKLLNEGDNMHSSPAPKAVTEDAAQTLDEFHEIVAAKI
jgi:hypothetical protein